MQPADGDAQARPTTSTPGVAVVGGISQWFLLQPLQAMAHLKLHYKDYNFCKYETNPCAIAGLWPSQCKKFVVGLSEFQASEL